MQDPSSSSNGRLEVSRQKNRR